MMRKFEKAKKMENGSRFLHIFAPCPTGWRIGSEMSVKIARLAVQTNVFPLYEVEGGINYILNFKGDRDVKDYLTAQGRFRHLMQRDYDRIQQMVNTEWKLLLRKASLE
jgi:pyruvate ferredoxin oxidoreductase beta subunit/2-oxoisovalerate ferredoxin oxidoreductase beta subunit